MLKSNIRVPETGDSDGRYKSDACVKGPRQAKDPVEVTQTVQPLRSAIAASLPRDPSPDPLMPALRSPKGSFGLDDGSESVNSVADGIRIANISWRLHQVGSVHQVKSCRLLYKKTKINVRTIPPNAK